MGSGITVAGSGITAPGSGITPCGIGISGVFWCFSWYLGSGVLDNSKIFIALSIFWDFMFSGCFS